MDLTNQWDSSFHDFKTSSKYLQIIKYSNLCLPSAPQWPVDPFDQQTLSAYSSPARILTMITNYA